ncbi:MAG TPA: protein kinase [Kofleriaceae bacterium]|nr:protein kinase [Kofleriaceae bacterium]
MADTAQMQPGEVLDGRYRVDDLIAVGGMGAVYKGTHLLLHKRIAIKVLRADLRSQDQMVERFQREAIAASAIGHENIVAVHDMGTTPDGTAYLVMELLEGQNLGDLIEAEAPLDMAAACDITLEILSGIAAAHHAGIVHRDLKPENIFMAQRPFGRERAKILDFGVSRLNSGVGSTPDVRLTTTGMIMGTPSYMSPEQARGDTKINHLTDIYATGVILYEMLAKTRPYGEQNYNVLVHKILSAETVPLSQHRDDIPEGLVDAIEKAMALTPNDRYPTAEDFAIAIAPYSSDPKLAPEAPASAPRARRSTGGGAYGGPSASAPTVAQVGPGSGEQPVVTAKSTSKVGGSSPPQRGPGKSAPPQAGPRTVASSPRSRRESEQAPPAVSAAESATIALASGELETVAAGEGGDEEVFELPPSRRSAASSGPAPVAATGPERGAPVTGSWATEQRDAPDKRSADKRVFQIGIGVTVLAVGGVGAFLFTRGGGKDEAPPKDKGIEALRAPAAGPAEKDETRPETPPPTDPEEMVITPEEVAEATGAKPTPAAHPGGHPVKPTPTPGAPQISITFNVTPKDASVTIDGEVVSGNTFRTEKSDVAAFLRIEAPGYQAYTAPVSLDRNDTVNVTLKPDKKPEGAETPPPPDKPADPPPADKPPDKPADPAPAPPPATPPG